MPTTQTTLSPSVSMLPHAVIRNSATRRATPQSVSTGEVNHDEYARDIQAFCTLLARIMMRCLKEHDERIIQALPSTSQVEAEA